MMSTSSTASNEYPFSAANTRTSFGFGPIELWNFTESPSSQWGAARHSTTRGRRRARGFRSLCWRPNEGEPMTPYEAIRVFAKTLENLEKWMDKAEEHAKDLGFEVDLLAQARLAPDQYSFIKQVQSACDPAKYAA